MSEPVRHVLCPNCGAQVAWVPENRFRPFCSERCKLVDLGAWATERYRVAGPGPEPGHDAAGDQDDASKT